MDKSVKININKHMLTAVSVLGLIGCGVLAFYAWRTGILTSPEAMQRFISGFGAAGVLLFILFQAVQVVVPILPGGIGCLGGVIMFGAGLGFVYNYVGIVIGSLMAFAIAKYCGRPILHQLFSEKTIEKYDSWTEKNSNFARLFAIAIFLPVAPDDFLCYLAGTTKLSWQRFTAIILLGKPAAIAAYSLGLTVIFKQFTALLAH